MPELNLPSWNEIHTIVFDFDGVFTDNKVWVDQYGVETVCVDRGDGLGLDLLRGFISKMNWNVEYFILSKEKNIVVSARAKKIQVDCFQSISDKAEFLVRYLKSKGLSANGMIYLGNDLNDLQAIAVSGFSVVPSDSHPLIVQQADLVLPQRGGNGFVRRFIELLIKLDEVPVDKVSALLCPQKENTK